MLNVHDIPPGKIRLSRQFPRLLVSCGDERDAEYRLWNVTQKGEDNSAAVPLHVLPTKQQKHKAMAQSVEHD